MPRDERRMTFIVVPHGGTDLGTRSFEVSYRRLRVVGLLLLAASIAWLLMAASWVYIASQAARVPGLQQEVVRLEGEQQRVTELASALRRLEGQYQQVREMLGATRPNEASSIWLPPVGRARSAEPAVDSALAAVPNAWPLTQPGFVTREHLGRFAGQHPGIDIAVPEGSYIRAAAAGVVLEAGEDDVYGKFVRLRHGGGYESVYGHASALFVAVADSVERHEVIALSGNTGTSTAPHLHFEIWKDGEPIDPRAVMQSPE